MKTQTFGERLQAILDERGMTAYALATKAKLPRQSVYRFLNGSRLPAWDSVLAIADALGVSLDKFRPKGKR